MGKNFFKRIAEAAKKIIKKIFKGLKSSFEKITSSGVPPIGVSPRGAPPRSKPPRGNPTSGIPPIGFPPSGVTPNRVPPRGVTPNKVPPSGGPPIEQITAPNIYNSIIEDAYDKFNFYEKNILFNKFLDYVKNKRTGQIISYGIVVKTTINDIIVIYRNILNSEYDFARQEISVDELFDVANLHIEIRDFEYFFDLLKNNYMQDAYRWWGEKGNYTEERPIYKYE